LKTLPTETSHRIKRNRKLGSVSISQSRARRRTQHHIRGIAVKQGYRLILADKDGVLVSEFQLTENDLADPEAFVATLKQSIEQVEEEET